MDIKDGKKSFYKRSTKLIFQLIISLFIVCLIFRITTHVKFEGRGWSTYIPYILFLTVFTVKRKPTWFVGFIYSAYGLYYYLSVLKQYPSYTEFTLPIVELFYGDGEGFSTASPIVHYLLLFPFIFYLVYTFSYLTSNIAQLIQYFNKRIGNDDLNDIIDQKI